MSSPEDFQDASTDYGPLTQRQAENVADLGARRATERMYAELGRSVVKKTIYLLGAATVVIVTWLSGIIHIDLTKLLKP